MKERESTVVCNPGYMLCSAVRCFLLVTITTLQLVPGDRIQAHEGNGLGAQAKEEVNASMLMYWNLFGKTGPKMSDISQGSLGNCYYLAGLAAIARTHPEIIENAFVLQGRNSRISRKIYQVRFLLDGVETLVAIDEKVPVRSTKTRTSLGSFFFSSTNDGHDVWPILMEKAWAKLFGSYLATVAGYGYEAFKAITQAPVDTHYSSVDNSGKRFWEDPRWLWNTLVDAYNSDFPMTASSMENSVGTVAGHAFAVVGLSDRQMKTVTVYNPWAANRYKGKLMRDMKEQQQGAYSMTFDEFQEAFRSINVARVRQGHRISYVRVSVGKPVGLRFMIRNTGPFAVQLEWPTSRVVNVHGCRLEPKLVKLLVRKQGGSRWYSGEAMKSASRSNLRVDLNERGMYLVYAYVAYSGAPVVSQAAINVYAAEDVTFLEAGKPPLDVGREILGFPCKFLVKPGQFFSYFDAVYEAVPFPVGGGPAWKKWGSQKVIWLGLNGLVRAPAIDRLDYYLPDFPFEELQCREDSNYKSAKDQPEEVIEGEKSGCGFNVGERVMYKHTDTWICSTIDFIHDGGELEVRYHGTEKEYMRCQSDKLARVNQCPWQEQDHVEVLMGGRQWVSDQIADVGCGQVTLIQGGTVPCDEKILRYPHGCPFHTGEKVIVWNKRVEEWHFAKVSQVHGDQATVLYGGGDKTLPCGDPDRLRKLSRCDKITHGQMERLKKLNNVDELLDGNRDSMFPPNLESIGPPSADCGDSATGSGPAACDKFNHWGTVSTVLN